MPAKPKSEKLADTPEVDAFMQKLDHPLKPVLQALREIILDTDPEIGEHVKWNAPSFLYIGEMRPFDPKEYKRYLIVSNFFQKDAIRLIFPGGASINDTSGLLQGKFPDDRKMAIFRSMEEVDARKDDLRAVIAKWLALLERR